MRDSFAPTKKAAQLRGFFDDLKWKSAENALLDGLELARQGAEVARQFF